jgi:hypothetical protein
MEFGMLEMLLERMLELLLERMLLGFIGLLELVLEVLLELCWMLRMLLELLAVVVLLRNLFAQRLQFPKLGQTSSPLLSNQHHLQWCQLCQTNLCGVNLSTSIMPHLWEKGIST